MSSKICGEKWGVKKLFSYAVVKFEIIKFNLDFEGDTFDFRQDRNQFANPLEQCYNL